METEQTWREVSNKEGNQSKTVPMVPRQEQKGTNGRCFASLLTPSDVAFLSTCGADFQHETEALFGNLAYRKSNNYITLSPRK